MALPKLPSLFKTPKHKQFELKTRYYNAEKAELDERISKIKKEILSEGAVVDADRQARLKEAFGRKRERMQFGHSGKINYRFILILLSLLALSYYILR